MEIDVIWTYFGHTTALIPLEPAEAMVGFEKIMRHKRQRGNPDRSRDNRHTKEDLEICLRSIGIFASVGIF